ncbi:MAG: L-histidine N(alpha)-methyltransferase [Chitinophagaceae bacterium]|nr:L-histidine N(alpha)-methyltransferase [Chitinophagaceae bacterium]
MAIYKHTDSEIICPPINRFQEDVLRGLSASPKFLQSKYFYDAEGDKLFQQIMQSPEYYLTNCELQIFSQQTADLAHTFLERYHDFDIIELGAGDATKSAYLLQYLKKLGLECTYFPVDISKNVIDLLEKELPEKIPGLTVTGLNGEYFEMIKAANLLSTKRKVVLFLGSNIGNFTPKEAVNFLSSLQDNLLRGDLVLIGFDLKKNPKQILNAYNDKAGITRQFNLNLLNRINHELNANFKKEQFDHYPTYNPISGACRSYLISLQEQDVRIGDRTIHFSKHEAVHMELSQKYTVPETDAMAIQTGFKTINYFFDSNGWFLDVVWEKD